MSERSRAVASLVVVALVGGCAPRVYHAGEPFNPPARGSGESVAGGSAAGGQARPGPEPPLPPWALEPERIRPPAEVEDWGRLEERFAGYRLGPGDAVFITVSNFGRAEEEESGERTVGPDGTIRHGKIRPIVASGLTADDLRAQVLDVYKTHGYKDLEVDVTVVRYRDRLLTVTGTLATTRLSVAGHETLFDALLAAGWKPDPTTLEEAVLIRGERRLVVPLARLAAGDPEYASVRTDEGDKILVRSPRVVSVEGAVKNVVTIPVASEGVVTLGAALQRAGGVLDEALLSEVRIERGQGEVATVNLAGVPAAALDGIPLSPGDRVVVPRAQPVILSGAFVAPGSYFLKGREAVELERFLVETGGVSPAAELSTLVLLRADGRVEKVDLADYRVHRRAGAVEVRPGDKIQLAGPTAVTFFVVGEVGREGQLRMDGRPTVSQALAQASFDFSRSAINRAVLVRGWPRDPRVIPIDFDKLFEEGDLVQNIQLADGDVIYVPRTTFAALADTFGQVGEVTQGVSGVISNLDQIMAFEEKVRALLRTENVLEELTTGSKAAAPAASSSSGSSSSGSSTGGGGK